MDQPIANPSAPSLAELRVGAVLTQEELAERAGVSLSTVCVAEAGKVEKPWPSTVRALAQAIGVSPQLVRQAILESRRRAFANSSNNGGSGHGA